MKKRIAKTSIAILFVIVIVLLLANLVIQPLSARPTVSDATDKLGGYTGNSGAGAADNVKADVDIMDANVDTILVDTAAQDTAPKMQLLVQGGVRIASVALTALTTADDLFQVTGGPIIIRDIVAVVQSGGMVATACELHYNIDPIAPATDTAFATDGTSLEINGDAEGSVYIWDGVIATDLTVTTNGVVLTQGTDVANGLLCPIGMIETVASATNAGDITFYIVYSPLSPSSLVTAQ